jgi:hypothetical protein
MIGFINHAVVAAQIKKHTGIYRKGRQNPGDSTFTASLAALF